MKYYTTIKDDNGNFQHFEAEQIVSFSLLYTMSIFLNKLVNRDTREILWQIIILNLGKSCKDKLFAKFEDARECFDEQVKIFKSIQETLETQKKLGRKKFKR